MSDADTYGASLQTFCAIGKQQDCLDGYEEVELLREEGKGCLTHMWFGGDWLGYERTRLRVYVDGETQPSIDMEMGMGHGSGFGDTSAPWGSEKVGKTGHPSGYYNSYKIPFGDGIRVTAQRDSRSPGGAAFWWIVRGTHNLPAPPHCGCPSAGNSASASLHPRRVVSPATGGVRTLRFPASGRALYGGDGGCKPAQSQ